MTADYKLTSDPNVVQRTSDGAFISNDNRNQVWNDYIQWLRVPDHTPDPADVPVVLTPREIAQALLGSTEPTAIVLRGLITLLAQRFGLTPAQVLTAIVNAAN